MIEDRIQNIQTRVKEAENLPEPAKAELLDLLSALKSEIAALSATHDEDARSISSFVEASAHEATRAQKKPELMEVALKGVSSSVAGFESSHPQLAQVVNRIATVLSNMGI